MIIVNAKDGNNVKFEIPDPFVSEKVKQQEWYVKDMGDYCANIANAQYAKNKEGFARNYDILKGILRHEDFYKEPEVKTFVDQLTRNIELPAHVKHYPILNPPINTMIGELSRRPDIARVKAMDSDSKSEQLDYLTEMVHEYIIQQAKAKILAKNGDLPEEEADQLTLERVHEELTSYTSRVERWANKILSSSKVEFNLKELSEDAFKDLLVGSREFFHIYEDNSKTGFSVEVPNPKKVFYLTMNDKKYTSDQSGGAKGAYLAGIIDVMELGEIIERFPLTKEEIDHLRENKSEANYMHVESSFSTRQVGISTIKYPTYSPLIEQEKMLLESQIAEDNDDLSSLLGINSPVTAYGNKFVVVQAYILSKKKIGSLVYIDKDGNEQTEFVDESYKKIPNEVSLTWGYINQWYKLLRVGPHIYHFTPLKCLDYCPIIGVVHDAKNSKATSLVDLMKPLQILYNICMNQLFRLLEKEIGVVYNINLRKIPTIKDGDAQDSLDIWIEEAMRKGITFEDDSIENTKVPMSNTNVARAIDLSRTNEIQSRYQLAAMLKNECWELVGITRQRLGGTSGSTETATATQAGLSQSYTQTEPYFAQHDYLLNQVYQAIVDMAKYVAIDKPQSTISLIGTEGENIMIQLDTNELKNRDLKVFITSRAEDQRVFQQMQQLADAMLQNGAEPYDVSILYTTNSVRQMKDIFKRLKEERQQMQQQQQQLEQQQLEQQQAQFEAQAQQAAAEKQAEMEQEVYVKQLELASRERVAIIGTYSRQEDNTKDADQSGTPDILEISKLALEKSKGDREHQAKMQELLAKNQTEAAKLSIEQEKLKVARENMKNDLQIARENRKGRSSAKKK